jgi:hypothetical protein
MSIAIPVGAAAGVLLLIGRDHVGGDELAHALGGPTSAAVTG